MNAENLINRGAALTLVPTSEGNKFPDSDKAYYFETPQFDGAEVAAKLGALLSKPEFSENLMTVKMCAAAAGGAAKAVRTVEEFYVESALMKPGKVYLEHRSDDDYVKKMRQAGCCLCCLSSLLIFGVILFLLVWGFPGVLNADEFSTHYIRQ